MHNKKAFLLITLAVICSPYTYGDHYNNDQQQTEPVVIDDTAPIDNEMQPETENKAGVTFTRKTNKTSEEEEEAALNKKENKQTIRGLFTLGGFNKNEKDKNKTRMSGKN